jgi:hypothetical protein
VIDGTQEVTWTNGRCEPLSGSLPSREPEQAYKWSADMEQAPGYDLVLRVTRTNTIPPDPYTSR